LEDQVNSDRERKDAVDQFAFCRAKIEVEAAIVFSKTRQAIQFIDLFSGED
jgi:hypothetical protein